LKMHNHSLWIRTRDGRTTNPTKTRIRRKEKILRRLPEWSKDRGGCRGVKKHGLYKKKLETNIVQGPKRGRISE